MKTHKNKKFYNFTPRQRGKIHRRHKYRNDHAPAWYRRMFNREWKAKCRHQTKEIEQYVRSEWDDRFAWYVVAWMDIPDNYPPPLRDVNWYYG